MFHRIAPIQIAKAAKNYVRYRKQSAYISRFHRKKPSPSDQAGEPRRSDLASEIGLVVAQHLAGGPEAQVYVHAGGEEMELYGSFETSFKENDSNAIAWPVPNVFGVRPRADRDR
jgi:hypothetical protein